MMNLSFILWALLLVDGVFGVEKVDVSVMKGDSVTLKHQTVIPEDASADWKFHGTIENIIANKNAADIFSTSEGDDGRFKGRLNLDQQTGSLTITNITPDHFGLYTLQISSTPAKIFSVTVRDVVKSVSVMEGDTVTLHTGVTGIQRDDQIQWKSGDQVLKDPDDTRWRNGDLTISNIKTDQSGEYELKIDTSSMILHRKLHINIHDVFSDEKDGVKTVSETMGDPVLLHTHVTHIQQNDPIEWTFGTQNIPLAKTDGTSDSISYNYNDERFKNRLYLDIRTGDLTIKKSSAEHSGLYQLKIITSSYTIQKSFSVAVSGEFSVDVSVMKGDSVTLKPRTEIPEDDSAQWWFGDKLIANMNKADGLFSTSEGDDVGFNGRLNLDHQTGSLTITNTRTDHTGLYKLKVIGRTDTYKIFSVTVHDPGLSVAWIVVGVLLVFVLVLVAVVICYRRKNSVL